MDPNRAPAAGNAGPLAPAEPAKPDDAAPLTAIELAVAAVGTQTALAAIVGVKPQAVQQWVASGRVPAERVLAIEAATRGRVTRHALRPDLFGPPPADASRRTWRS